MKQTLYFVTIFLFLSGIFSCKKVEDDPLAEYAKYGIFKEIYPLQDSVNVDLRQGDSTSIETNKGKMWVRIKNIDVICFKGSNNNSCPDAGIAVLFNLQINGKNQEFIFGLDDYPKDNSRIKYILGKCNETLPVDSYGVLKTVGNMNIEWRNIYPNPSTEMEHKVLKATNGYHTTITFQKICR